MDYDKLKTLSSFEEISYNQLCPVGFSLQVKIGMNLNKNTKVFLLKNTYFGLIIEPPPYMDFKNIKTDSGNLLWFNYYMNNTKEIVITAKSDLYNILELVDRQIADDLIFNLNLF